MAPTVRLDFPKAVGDCVLRRLDAWSLRQLAELADAFARVRARHALLLDVVPSRCEKAIPSVEEPTWTREWGHNGKSYGNLLCSRYYNL